MKQITLSEIRGNDLQAIELQGSLLERSLMLKYTGIGSKTFHYWKMNGLISSIGSSTWAEVNFVEYVWLKVLDTMRGFGCSIKLMKQIHEDQFIKAYEEDLSSRTLEENIAYYKSLQKIRKLNKDEQDRLDKSIELSKDPFLKLALRTEISYFYQILLECIVYGRDAGIEIYPDGSYKMIRSEEDRDKLRRPHIHIPFSYYVAELFTEKDKLEFITKAGLVNTDEQRLLQELHGKNVEKITITIDKESGKPKKIEYDRGGLIEGDKAKEVMRLLGLKNYSSIKLSTRNGTTLSFTKTEKKMIE
jgi:hypothetical protein